MSAPTSGSPELVLCKRPAAAGDATDSKGEEQDALDYKKSMWLKKQKDLGNLTQEHLHLKFH